jgi:two-component system cell cycle response regulator
MAESADKQASDKPRILIIDDSRLVRVSLSNVLQDEFHIGEAEDGEAGWAALLADDQTQVVLTDAGMPKLDGYGLIERIRAHDVQRIREIPIIMITAADDEESRQRALALGATDFITKPFDKAQLLARVRAQAKLDKTTRDLAERTTDDVISGVRSRRYFLKRGEQDLAFAGRHNQDLSVIVVAIDDLDAIKESGGGAAVNAVLVAVAGALKDSVRKEDTLARSADAQFAIIAPTLAAAEAESVCDRIRQQISALPVTAATEVSLTVSIGLVNRVVDAANTIEEYLTQAEQYVSKAQAAGGNGLMATRKKETPAKRVSIDAALRILAMGDPEKLLPHLMPIAEQILPLLEFCNQKQQWGIESELRSIKEKLDAAG